MFPCILIQDGLFSPDGSFYVADGYNGTRVAKFDANGKFLLDFGMAGERGKETRPGYMNNVHGVAIDVETRRVFVNDRENPHPDLRRERHIPHPSGRSPSVRRASTSSRSARIGHW